MDESAPKMKVTDRRHFTADGELKSEADASSEDSSSATSVASPEPRADARPDDFADVPPVSFASFIISLATQAADMIGGEQKDLGGARQVISAIEMLKDKTEGRRTAEETKIIDAILFDLRLAFVGSARGARP